MSPEDAPPRDEEMVPPFWGAQVWEPPMEEVNPHLSRMSLLVGRWGFSGKTWRRGCLCPGRPWHGFAAAPRGIP